MEIRRSLWTKSKFKIQDSRFKSHAVKANVIDPTCQHESEHDY